MLDSHLTPEKTMVDKGAVFSPDKTYRYSLRRLWDLSLRPCCFVMLNPSTADEEVNDRTITKCLRFARIWGYGGLIVGNLFAYVATSPRDLYAVKDPVGPENDQYLRQLHEQSGITVAAWGENGKLRSRGYVVMRALTAVKQVAFLQKTRDGQPEHPLYLKPNTQPRFDFYPEDRKNSTEPNS